VIVSWSAAPNGSSDTHGASWHRLGLRGRIIRMAEIDIEATRERIAEITTGTCFHLALCQRRGQASHVSSGP
jgi:hypothetical protein